MSNRCMRRFPLLLTLLIVLTACGGAPALPQTTAPKTSPTEATAEPLVETTEATTEATAAEETPEATPEATSVEETPEATTEAATPAIEATPEATPASTEAGGTPLTFGMVLIGPINDRGWSQAHYDAAIRVEREAPGTKFIYVDKVNPADRPNVQVQQVVDDLVAQGARLIITNSDDFKDGTREAAEAHPDVSFIHISGDDVLTGQAPPNLGNIMGKMEYGKMIGGCAAALQTQTGKIGYLGPLINDETRRLVNATYLGARHCWTNVLNKPAADLKLKVTSIGFWFKVPGLTLDPTKAASDFLTAGYDVVISGIDTTEGLVESNKAKGGGKKVFAVPYAYRDACAEAPDVCLGVPYFNWAPVYLETVKAVQAGTWRPAWRWLSPDWNDINNEETSAVGFLKGAALTRENSGRLDSFITGLGDGSINLWQGPLDFQNGTPFLKEGEIATDQQIWDMPQLLEGIDGPSS